MESQKDRRITAAVISTGVDMLCHMLDKIGVPQSDARIGIKIILSDTLDKAIERYFW